VYIFGTKNFTPGNTFLPPLIVALRLLKLLSQGLVVHNWGNRYLMVSGQTDLHHNDTHVQLRVAPKQNWLLSTVQLVR
jgi:hypothetical protein